MASVVTLKMTKNYDKNVVGDVATFSPKTAEFILKNSGGEKLAEWDDATHRFDVKTSKAVPLPKKAEAA